MTRRTRRATRLRLIATSVSLGLLLAGCGTNSQSAVEPSVSATAANDPSTQALLRVIDQQTNGMITAREQGARFPGGKWVAKEALKGLSKAVRDMRGDQLREVFRFLDDDAANALVRNSNRVADEIDKLVPYLDLPEAILRERLFNGLSSFMAPGSAMQIADAVARVIGFLL